MRGLVIILAVLALAGCVRVVKPEYRAQAGGNVEQLARDNADCKAQAAMLPYEDYFRTLAFLDNCMRARGYIRAN